MLKPGQILFKEGDESDGMFLVRSGELAVFLAKDDKQVVLATVGAGGMIGEMALFDNKPRSASVKAVSSAEVTVITNDDFSKLLRQIPKWFVALMSTLSGRLRSTNERLQKLEGLSASKPFEKVLIILRVLNLIWHKDGSKQGKEWHLDAGNAIEPIKAMMGKDDAGIVEPVIDVLSNAGLFAAKKSSYNGKVLVLANRGTLERFIEFVGVVSATCKRPGLSNAAFDILKLVKLLAQQSAYDNFTNSLKELILSGKKEGYQTIDTWNEAIQEFHGVSEELQVVKTSDGSPGLRADKKGIDKLFQFHSWLRALAGKDLIR
jgi:hypothetical protein